MSILSPFPTPRCAPQRVFRQAVKVGLTGGIGSGKTAVAECFAARGVPVIDADVIARELVAPGEDAFAAVVGHFGSAVVAADGGLDRAALRRRIFASPRERAWLEALLHPAIAARMRDRAAEVHAEYVLLVIPLLFETDQRARVDRVLLVDAPDTLRMTRVCRRDGISEAEAAAILAAQWPRERRLTEADDILANEGDREALDRGVAALHERYRTLGNL